MPGENTNIKEKNKTGLKEPNQYSVVFHNDDFTPMEFVTLILMHIFFKTEADALNLMMKVHQEGKALIGTYSYDIASSKADTATNLARKNGYPLRISIQKV